ncbi:expressed unknown protein [Seminavis robusta]|uniref:Uncharacterized protein n=1 Tax=Seminavis robusta TaxID=568900 RepID=A0A9N8ENY3_9STRA|nr:expressed unknown protein [Seminavis robusta]|eukprot:Sro1419_g271090.1 n/a (1072) ;mRNA; r:14118-17426
MAKTRKKWRLFNKKQQSSGGADAQLLGDDIVAKVAVDRETQAGRLVEEGSVSLSNGSTNIVSPDRKKSKKLSRFFRKPSKKPHVITDDTQQNETFETILSGGSEADETTHVTSKDSSFGIFPDLQDGELSQNDQSGTQFEDNRLEVTNEFVFDDGNLGVETSFVSRTTQRRHGIDAVPEHTIEENPFFRFEAVPFDDIPAPSSLQVNDRTRAKHVQDVLPSQIKRDNSIAQSFDEPSPEHKEVRGFLSSEQEDKLGLQETTENPPRAADSSFNFGFAFPSAFARADTGPSTVTESARPPSEAGSAFSFGFNLPNVFGKQESQLAEPSSSAVEVELSCTEVDGITDSSSRPPCHDNVGSDSHGTSKVELPIVSAQHIETDTQASDGRFSDADESTQAEDGTQRDSAVTIGKNDETLEPSIEAKFRLPSAGLEVDSPADMASFTEGNPPSLSTSASWSRYGSKSDVIDEETSSAICEVPAEEQNTPTNAVSTKAEDATGEDSVNIENRKGSDADSETCVESTADRVATHQSNQEASASHEAEDDQSTASTTNHNADASLSRPRSFDSGYSKASPSSSSSSSSLSASSSSQKAKTKRPSPSLQSPYEKIYELSLRRDGTNHTEPHDDRLLDKGKCNSTLEDDGSTDSKSSDDNDRQSDLKLTQVMDLTPEAMELTPDERSQSNASSAPKASSEDGIECRAEFERYAKPVLLIGGIKRRSARSDKSVASNILAPAKQNYRKLCSRLIQKRISERRGKLKSPTNVPSNATFSVEDTDDVVGDKPQVAETKAEVPRDEDSPDFNVASAAATPAKQNYRKLCKKVIQEKISLRRGKSTQPVQSQPHPDGCSDVQEEPGSTAIESQITRSSSVFDILPTYTCRGAHDAGDDNNDCSTQGGHSTRFNEADNQPDEKSLEEEFSLQSEHSDTESEKEESNEEESSISLKRRLGRSKGMGVEDDYDSELTPDDKRSDGRSRRKAPSLAFIAGLNMPALDRIANMDCSLFGKGRYEFRESDTDDYEDVSYYRRGGDDGSLLSSYDDYAHEFRGTARSRIEEEAEDLLEWADENVLFCSPNRHR